MTEIDLLYNTIPAEFKMSRTQPSAESDLELESQRLLSTMESSSNDHNRARLLSSSSNHNRRSALESSTTTHTGQRSSALKDSSTHSTGEEVVIEERRKKANGEGFTVHRYIRGRLLGKGGFAKVYLCTAVDTNKQYAVKVVPKANLVKQRARQKLQAEIKIHRTLKHPHVCEYKHFFEDRQNCYILLELCHNQSMNELIKRRKRLTEPEAAFFMAQLLEAVRYMHDQNVIHRDLKLGNLFLDKQIHIKVGDLGLATRVEDKDEKRKTICGTPNYIAPEVIQGDKATRGHSFEVDVWSMGVILYTILIGKPPYEAKDVKATYQRIINNEYSFPKHIPVSADAQTLIESMLQSKPTDRPSLDEIEAHPFLATNMIPMELPSAALHYAPNWRVNEFGAIELDDDGTKKKGAGSRSSSRQPFGYRDPNAKGTASSTASSIKPRDSGIDMQRIVRSAMVMSGATSTAPVASAPKPAVPQPAFRIFDETGGLAPYEPRQSNHSKPPQARPSPFAEELLVRRTKALSIADPSPRASEYMLRSPSAMSAMSATSSISGMGSDAETLLRMVERLDTVVDITQSRKGSYRQQMPRPVSPACGPKMWVTRYVDYTSKYGLGFLLNDNSSGVYFNDSTKTALVPDGETFQYVERRRSEETPDPRRLDSTVETYTLSDFPESLKKKVTLLKHFRNYLLEQQKDEDEAAVGSDAGPYATNLVYVKKWVRTKHAILFRLSNLTVQVVFYDQSEILLTPDDRYITYVDKNRKRATYHFTDELVGSSPELEKRLKYTKEIMSQLLSGRQQR